MDGQKIYPFYSSSPIGAAALLSPLKPKAGWLGLRPGWLGLRSGWVSLGDAFGLLVEKQFNKSRVVVASEKGAFLLKVNKLGLPLPLFICNF